jgi:hypothetical protein
MDDEGQEAVAVKAKAAVFVGLRMMSCDGRTVKGSSEVQWFGCARRQAKWSVKSDQQVVVRGRRGAVSKPNSGMNAPGYIRSAAAFTISHQSSRINLVSHQYR